MIRGQPILFNTQENTTSFKSTPFYPGRYPNGQIGMPTTNDPSIKPSQTIIKKTVTPIQHISTPMKSVPLTTIPTNTMNHQGSKDVIISQPVNTVVGGGYSMNQINKTTITNNETQVVSNIPNKPPSTSRIEYIPYQKTVTQYQTRQILTSMWVPIQKKCLNYYAIQNITQFIPRQIQQIRYQMIPQQQIQYRLQYVPIQRQIIHLPTSEIAQNSDRVYGGISQMQTAAATRTTTFPEVYRGGRTQVTSPISIPGYQELPNSRISTIPKSNFVTTDGYVPSYLNPTPIPVLPRSSKVIIPETIQPPRLSERRSSVKQTQNQYSNPELVEGLLRMSGVKQTQNQYSNPELVQGLLKMSGVKQPQNQYSNPELVQGLVRMSGVKQPQNQYSNPDLVEGLFRMSGVQRSSRPPSYQA